MEEKNNILSGHALEQARSKLILYKKSIDLKERLMEVQKNLFNEFKKNPRPIELKFEYEKSDSYWDAVIAQKAIELEDQLFQVENDIMSLKMQIPLIEDNIKKLEGGEDGNKQ